MNDSLSAIHTVHEQFTNLLQTIETLAAAAQENSTATEEIVASIHDENELFEQIAQSARTLQSLNNELLTLVH
jgi:methyl-accepting chemotaxis protein